MRAILHRKDGVDRHEVTRFKPVRKLDHLSLFVTQRDPRFEVAASLLLLPVDDDAVRDTGCFIHHFAHGYAVDQVDVVHDTFLFGDDRNGVGIPFREALSLRHLTTFVDEKLGAIGYAVACPVTSVLVLEDDFEIPAHHDRHAIRIHDHVPVVDGDHRVGRRFDRALLRATLCRTADMEGAHRELRARLTDRLCGDHADSLA